MAWERAIGPNNTQHANQDYTLDEHTLNTITWARQSPYYQPLSDRDKHLVTVASLFHDIEKHCGPANLKPIIPTDKVHPEKSADTVRRTLPTLGYNAEETDLVARLVEHHQAIGNMIVISLGKPIKDSRPPDVLIDRAVAGIKDQRTLAMLCALTEGDIRSLKANHERFTPETEAKLKWFSELVAEKIEEKQKEEQQKLEAQQQQDGENNPQA